MDCGCVPAGFLLLPATLFCSPRKLASVSLPRWQSFEPRFVGRGCMSAQRDVRKSVRRRTSGSNLSLSAFAALRFLSGHSLELCLVYRHGRPSQRDRNAMVRTRPLSSGITNNWPGRKPRWVTFTQVEIRLTTEKAFRDSLRRASARRQVN
jgi:hypothetical protein